MAPRSTRSNPERVPQHVRVLLAANFVSEVGSGLTLPFLLVYLHEVRHIPLGITGLLIGGASVVAIPVGPAAGTLVDKLGPRLVCSVALLFDAVGTVGLVFVHSPLSALPVLFLYGIGNGATWPAWNALFAIMVRDETLRPRVFARSFQLLNLGLGTGAVVAGVVVHLGHPRSFEMIYLIDGVTYLSVILALVLLPASAFALVGSHAPESEAPDAGVARTGGYREVIADRRFRRYLVSATLLAFAGYAAVNAGLVGYATVVVHAQPYVIAWAFAANTGLIVLLQPLALRLVGRMRRTTALSLCGVLMGGSWFILALSGAFPRSELGNSLVVAMFAVFALGEVLLSPVAAPLVTMMARPELQGRYNATAASVYSVTSVIGPAVAGWMLGAGLANVYLGLLVGCAALAVLGFRWTRHTLSPEIDNAEGALQLDREPISV